MWRVAGAQWRPGPGVRAKWLLHRQPSYIALLSLFTCSALCRVINTSRCSVKLGRTYRGRPPEMWRCGDAARWCPVYRRRPARKEGRKCLSKNTYAVMRTNVHIFYCIYNTYVCIGRKNLCIARKGGTKVLSYGKLIRYIATEGSGHLVPDSWDKFHVLLTLLKFSRNRGAYLLRI